MPHLLKVHIHCLHIYFSFFLTFLVTKQRPKHSPDHNYGLILDKLFGINIHGKMCKAYFFILYLVEKKIKNGKKYLFSLIFHNKMKIIFWEIFFIFNK